MQAQFTSLAATLGGENAHFAFFYDESLSHLIYAGCDLIAVPSMFEPCGLTQVSMAARIWWSHRHWGRLGSLMHYLPMICAGHISALPWKSLSSAALQLIGNCSDRSFSHTAAAMSDVVRQYA